MRRFIDFSGRGTRTQSQRRSRRSRRGFLEHLEQRLVLNATIAPVVTGQNVALNWTGDTTADNVTLTYDFNTLNYEYSDPGHTIAVTPDASIVITNNNSSDVEIAPAITFSVNQLTFTDGTNVTPVSGNTYNLASPNFGAPIDVIGPGAAGTVADNVNLGTDANGLGAGSPM